MIAGPEAFPVALVFFLVGGIIELVGLILEVFRKEEKSLVEQIAMLLIRARAPANWNSRSPSRPTNSRFGKNFSGYARSRHSRGASSRGTST